MNLPPCPVCDRVPTDRIDQAEHYEGHIARGERSTRPVSCWRCATDMRTVRLDDGRIAVRPCSCGWVHPSMPAAPPADVVTSPSDAPQVCLPAGSGSGSTKS